MPRVKRSPRNSVSDRPSRWRLALRRQRRLLRPALWTLAASSVAVLLVVALHSAAPRSTGTLSSFRERIGAATAASGLRVTDVVVEGRANTPEPLLRAAIGVNKGDPTLGFSLDDIKTRLESIKWVEQATVERRLPGTLVINLQERRPFAVWQSQNKFVVVDRTGQVVTNHDLGQFPKLPLIVGQGAPGAAALLLDALRERPSLEEKVEASVRVGERRWNLRMTNGADVMLPEGHEVAALDKLLQLQQDHAVLDRPLAAIDMRLPDRLVFRPRNDVRDDLATPPLPPPASPPTVPIIAKKPT
jgi:cell division protein FtsQ